MVAAMKEFAAQPEELLAHAGWLRALAATLVRDASSADDLVQDTWIAALQRPPRADRPLRPWLARVLRNLAKNERRASRRRAEHELDAHPAGSGQGSDELVAELEGQRLLVEALLGLEEPLRSTIVLRYFRGLDATRIGEMQGVPPGTVRWRLKQGIEALRARMDARFGGSRESWCALLLPLAWRPDAAGIAGGSAVAASAVTAPGVVVMSALLKVGAATALIAVAGWWWWEGSQGGVPAEPVAAGAPKVAVPEPEPSKPAARELEVPAAESHAERLEVAAPVAEPAVAAAPPRALPPSIVTARFVDESGAPWGGVLLAFLGAVDVVMNTNASALGSSPQSAVSTLDGLATLTIPWKWSTGERRSASFVAARAGCATAVLKTALEPGQTSHLGDVVLGPGTTMHGVVLDARQRPIADAHVGVTRATFSTDPLHVGRIRRNGEEEFHAGPQTSTAADGSFRLEGVAPGSLRVWANAAEMRYAWTEPMEVKADAEVFGLVLELSPMLPTDRISGRVVDPTGLAIPNAPVVYDYQVPGEGGSTGTSTDANGEFSILLRYETPHKFFASDPLGRFAPVSQELPPGSLDVLLKLGELRYLEVRVQDGAGKPIAGAKVATGQADGMSIGDSRGTTDEQGLARVGVPPYEFKVQASAAGFLTELKGPFDALAPPERVEFGLRELPVLRGRVLAGSQPFAGAQVQLREDVSDRHVAVDGFPCVLDPANRVSSASSDAQGRFALAAEEPGRYWVRATAAGYAPAEAGPFQLDTGQAPQGVELELTHGGVLEGRVLLDGGRDGAGTIVGINHGDGEPRTQRAGPGGSYRFEGLTPGSWQVLAREEERRPENTTTSYGGTVQPIAWSCRVLDGRTTRFDLDLTKR
jgi:RNA polymerase sigma factor (sigma-70 family)